MENYCTYCGMAQGDRVTCCDENHWMTAQEYRDYHGYAPDDGTDDECYVCGALDGDPCRAVDGKLAECPR